jgi:CheY-like chemotaxis protein
MPIMDGLAATKKIRALEAGFAAEQEREKQGDPASGANTKEDQPYTRIPIVGLSADIQLATKEVTCNSPLKYPGVMMEKYHI